VSGKNAMETEFNSDNDSWISVGSSIAVGNRVLYPIARVSVLIGIRGILGCKISPIAILIREPDNAYAISLSKEEITLDHILELMP
jgi:hypothetical protein